MDFHSLGHFMRFLWSSNGIIKMGPGSLIESTAKRSWTDKWPFQPFPTEEKWRRRWWWLLFSDVFPISNQWVWIGVVVEMNSVMMSFWLENGRPDGWPRTIERSDALVGWMDGWMDSSNNGILIYFLSSSLIGRSLIHYTLAREDFEPFRSAIQSQAINLWSSHFQWTVWIGRYGTWSTTTTMTARECKSLLHTSFMAFLDYYS